MSGDLSLHIVHTPVTYFDGVGVTNFVKRMSSWEGLSNDCQELFSYVGLNIFTKWRVEPCDFSISNFLSCGFIPGIGVKG